MDRPIEPDEVWQWDCPFCDESRLKPSFNGPGKENAMTALRNHIIATDGEGHGPVNEPPSSFDQSKLPEYVIEIDETGESVDF